VTIAVLNYTLMLNRLIQKARRSGVISRDEADYLRSMAQNSIPASSTRGLVGEKGAPDFQYAALHFSTMIWQAGDAAEDDAKARQGTCWRSTSCRRSLQDMTYSGRRSFSGSSTMSMQARRRILSNTWFDASHQPEYRLFARD